MTRSLTSRLRLAIGLVGGALLGLACVALAILMERTLLAEFDAALATESKALSVLVETAEEGLHSEIRERQLEQYNRAEDPHYYQVRDQAGLTVERSLNLGQLDLPAAKPPRGSPQFVNLRLPNGRPGRAVVLEFDPHSEASETGGQAGAESLPGGTRQAACLTVARETTDLQQSIDRTRLQLAVVFAGALGILLSVVRPLVAYGLKPLTATTEQIERIDEHHLDSRIDVMPPRELQPVIAKLNGLLSRIEVAFQRERVLSANIAHELRTPLAGIHATLDVALGRNRPAAEMHEAMVECLRICRETEGMIESLLALSRIDSGKGTVHLQTADLVPLIQEVWGSFDEEARQKDVTVSWQLPPSAKVSIDIVKVKVILRNLIQNAVTYVNSTGAIAISLELRRSEAELRIANSGSELSHDDARFAFDRFWRGESARSRTGQNAGLGLALCRELTELLGASITVSSNPGGDFVAVLRLPLGSRKAA